MIKVIVSSARDAGFMINKAKKYIIGNDDRQAQIIKQDNNFTIQKTFEPHSRSFIWNAGAIIPITIRSLL